MKRNTYRRFVFRNFRSRVRERIRDDFLRILITLARVGALSDVTTAKVCVACRERYAQTEKPFWYFSSLALFNSVKKCLEESREVEVIEILGWSKVTNFSRYDIEIRGVRNISGLIVTKNLPRPDVADSHNDDSLSTCGFCFYLESGDWETPSVFGLSIKGLSINSALGGESSFVVLNSDGEFGGFVDSVVRKRGFDSTSKIWLFINKETALHICEMAVEQGEASIASQLVRYFAPEFGVNYRWNQILATTDLSLSSYEIKELKGDRITADVYLAQNIQKEPIQLEANLGATVVQLSDVKISGLQYFSRDESTRYLEDRGGHPKYRFVAGLGQSTSAPSGTWQRSFTKQQPLPTRPKIVEEAGSILGRSSTNYFHALIEYLPRIITLQRDFPNFDGPVLVNDDYPETIRQLLAQILPKERWVEVGRDESVLVKDLLLPTFHSCIPDLELVPWFKGAAIDFGVISEFRNQCLAFKTEVETPRKIFLLRRSNSNKRDVFNIDEIAQIALKYGYEIVDPVKLSIFDQINLFNRATHIVAPGGAVFANLIFCQEGTRVIGLVSNRLSKFAIHSTIARQFGAEFFYVAGPSDNEYESSRVRAESMHSVFAISPKRFEKRLNEIE